MIHKCTNCEYNTPYKTNLHRHIKNKHNFENIQDGGSQTDILKTTFHIADVMKLIDESLEVFHNYMRMKMEPTGFGSEEMIEEGINVFKCYMINKIIQK